MATQEKYDHLLDTVINYEITQNVVAMRASLKESFPDLDLDLPGTMEELKNPYRLLSPEAMKRDKSLGVLSQKFLMLFLISKVFF